MEEFAVAVDGNDVALALPHGTAEAPATPLYHRGTDEHPVRKSLGLHPMQGHMTLGMLVDAIHLSSLLPHILMGKVTLPLIITSKNINIRPSLVPVLHSVLPEEFCALYCPELCA